MSTALRLRRGTSEQHQTFTGLMAEPTYDITKKTIVIHDGETPGGIPLAKETALEGAIRSDAPQVLTPEAKATARSNIGAAPVPTASGLLANPSGGDFAARAIEAGAGISVLNGDGIEGNPVVANTGVLSVNGQTGVVSITGYSLAELKNEDGAGSGLDADLLDGLESSAFKLRDEEVSAGDEYASAGSASAATTSVVSAQSFAILCHGTVRLKTTLSIAAGSYAAAYGYCRWYKNGLATGPTRSVLQSNVNQTASGTWYEDIAVVRGDVLQLRVWRGSNSQFDDKPAAGSLAVGVLNLWDKAPIAFGL